MSGEKEKILETAIDLFFKLGIRNVTMDHLAEELGMSKKTLYVHYATKGELVDQSVNHLFNSISAQIMKVVETEENAIEELFAIDAIVCGEVKTHHPALLFELAKHYPNTFQTLMQKREQLIKKTTSLNLEKGIKEGLYRNDLNIEFITDIYYGKLLVLNNDGYFDFEKHNPAEIYHQNLLYHLRGIVSGRGYQYLEQKTTKP